jgi:hypothetical protein
MEYWSAGVLLKYWSTGVMEWWSDGVMEKKRYVFRVAGCELTF